MFLLPIGHEDLSVRRLPWVTISIALICTAIQVDACVVEGELDAPLERLNGEISEIVQTVALECRRTRTCPGGSSEAPAILEALRARTLGDTLTQERFAVLDGEVTRLIGRHPVLRFGYRPGLDSWWKMLSSIFTHGGFAHLIGNMLFLYLVGTSIEDRWGRLRFLAFYLVGGLVAAGTFSALHWGSSIRLVGASGAIAAAMGAFALLFWRTKIRFFYAWWLVVIRVGTFSAPAWLVLPLWFLEQLWEASSEVSGASVAYSAHAGGFAFGVVVALALRGLGLDERFTEEMDQVSGGWTENPIFVEASQLAEGGRHRLAIGRLAELLAKEPEHEEARALMFDLAQKTQNPQLMQRYGASLFAQWVRSEPAKVLTAYQGLVKLSSDGVIDERVLQQVLTAARALRDEAVVQDVLRRLYQSYPRSGHIPRGLWAVAELYALSQRPELELRVLERLVQDYPLDPWAERARARLESLVQRS